MHFGKTSKLSENGFITLVLTVANGCITEETCDIDPRQKEMRECGFAFVSEPGLSDRANSDGLGNYRQLVLERLKRN